MSTLWRRLKTGERLVNKIGAIRAGRCFIVREENDTPVLVGKFIGRPHNDLNDLVEPKVKAKIRRIIDSKGKVQEVTLGVITDLGVSEEATRHCYIIPYDPLIQ